MVERGLISEIKTVGTSSEPGFAIFEDRNGSRVTVAVIIDWEGKIEHTCFTYSRVVHSAIPGPVLQLPNETLFWQSPEGLPWEQKPGENAEYAEMRLVELISQ